MAATTATNPASIQREARIGGLLYVVIIVTALFAEAFVRSSMIVSTDAVATAHNIMASQRLYRLGGAADLVNLGCDVALSIILYDLLRPVSRSLALTAIAFRLVADACLIVATFFHFAPLFFLGGAGYLNVMPVAQLQALALESIKIHALGYEVCMVFFGIHAMLAGWLIARSTYIPRLIGLLLAVSGALYVANSFAGLVYPELNVPIYLLLPGFLAENALAWWLLIRGVNVARWQAHAVAGPA
jgi:hypothetical protein